MPYAPKWEQDEKERDISSVKFTTHPTKTPARLLKKGCGGESLKRNSDC
jgi:hypothetical protein